MNDQQRLWWKQASSDIELFVRLRQSGAQECHLLHYLQMASEKISKAYFWRSGHAPPKTHTGFFRFLKALLDRPQRDLERISNSFGFARSADFEIWVKRVQPLAYALQNIAPAEANDGPNPEYPWPHASPISCPTDHKFDLWNKLLNTGQGRKMLEFIRHSIGGFDAYA